MDEGFRYYTNSKIKQSVSKRGHKKQKSRGTAADWFRRIRDDDFSDRKAQSVEPSTGFGKRWEDLIDAAASATEDIDEDRTPVSCIYQVYTMRHR